MSASPTCGVTEMVTSGFDPSAAAGTAKVKYFILLSRALASCGTPSTSCTGRESGSWSVTETVVPRSTVVFSSHPSWCDTITRGIDTVSASACRPCGAAMPTVPSPWLTMMTPSAPAAC
eukprot:2720525-Prymnesium_polylepis.1